MELVADIHPSVAWALAIITVSVFVATAWKVLILPLWRGIRMIGHFLDDWYGREDVNGPTPGIRARLLDTEHQVAAIHKQTHINGGQSLKDVVLRTEAKLDVAARVIDDHVIEAQEHTRRIDELEAATQDAAVAASQAATDAKTAATALHEIRTLVRSAEYNSKPNGGGSGHDALMSQIVGLRDDLAAHVEQTRSIHEEQAAAIAYLADHGAGEDPGA